MDVYTSLKQDVTFNIASTRAQIYMEIPVWKMFEFFGNLKQIIIFPQKLIFLSILGKL